MPTLTPSPAALAAECSALIEELECLRQPLRAMDAAGGAFLAPDEVPGRTASGGKAAATGTSAASGRNGVSEVSARVARIEARVNVLQASVSRLVREKFVASGFPSGGTKQGNN